MLATRRQLTATHDAAIDAMILQLHTQRIRANSTQQQPDYKHLADQLNAAVGSQKRAYRSRRQKILRRSEVPTTLAQLAGALGVEIALAVCTLIPLVGIFCLAALTWIVIGKVIKFAVDRTQLAELDAANPLRNVAPLFKANNSDFRARVDRVLQQNPLAHTAPPSQLQSTALTNMSLPVVSTPAAQAQPSSPQPPSFLSRFCCLWSCSARSNHQSVGVARNHQKSIRCSL